MGALRAGEPVAFERPEVDPDEPLALIYTSGTTGQPKGVIFTNRSILGFISEWGLIEPGFRHGMRQIMVLPLGGAPGTIWGILHCFVRGGTFFLHRQFDPAATVQAMEEDRITCMLGVPVLYEQMAAQEAFADADLSSWDTGHVGGAPVSDALLDTYNQKGVLLRQIYGMTEAGGSATVNTREEALSLPDYCGQGGPFTRLRVVRDDGTDCDPGEPGEILVKGPAVTPGYWRNEQATAETIVDGWLHSGDIGVLNEHGSLKMLERKKDMIISGGLNIAPAEIENKIMELDVGPGGRRDRGERREVRRDPGRGGLLRRGADRRGGRGALRQVTGRLQGAALRDLQRGPPAADGQRQDRQANAPRGTPGHRRRARTRAVSGDRIDGVAVAGIGETGYFKRGTAGRGAIGLCAEAVLKACEDAGLDPRDVDGFASYGDDSNDGPNMAVALGLRELRWSSMVWGGGGGGLCGAIAAAAAAIASGQARRVIVLRGHSEGSGDRLSKAVSEYYMGSHYRAHGIISPAQICAMRMRRLIDHDGVPASTMRALAQACYFHAKANPGALGRDIDLTDEVYEESRWIAEPYHLYDCSRENDGAAALLLTSTEEASALGSPAVHLIAAAQSNPPEWGVLLENDDDYTSAGFRLVAERLWKATGLGPGRHRRHPGVRELQRGRGRIPDRPWVLLGQ